MDGRPPIDRAALERSARLGRRAFLAGGAAAFAAAGYATGRATAPEGWTGPATGAAPPTPADAAGWAEVRAEFAAPADMVHLDAFVLGPPSAPVREAVDAHRRALDRDGHAYLESAEASAEDAVRSAAAAYMGTDAALVALTDSTSMGIGLMYGGLRLRPGDEVVTTDHDFYATHEALRFAALRSGARATRVALYDDPATASPAAMVARLIDAVTPATRVVGVTWVHSGTGVKLPVRALADALAERNEGRPEEERALLAVDGVHGFGSQPEAVAELGCDLFAAGGHKWLHGPRGTGVLWGSDAAWSRLVPIVPTFSRPQYGDWMAGRPADLGAHDWGTTMTPGGYHSFEQRWALAQAFGFHLDLGREAVASRIAALTEQLKTGLAGLGGVRVHTPAAAEASAGIVCFELDGSDPERAAAALADRSVRVSVAPYATRHLRAGATLLADEAGIDRALAAVAEVARA